MSQFVLWCKNLSPWQQRGFVFMLGSLNVLALAPFYIVPVIFITIPFFLIIHDCAQNRKEAFLTAWFFSFGYFIFGLYWIAHALFIDIAQFWWAIPFAIMGLPFALSFFWGAAGIALYGVKGVAKVFLFAAFFGLTEWLRGHLLTGFPWNLLGYIWVDTPSALQITSLMGIYGLTLYTFLIASILYPFLIKKELDKPLKIGFFIIFVPFFTLLIWGQKRIPITVQKTGTIIRLVQPNIDQADKWNPDLMPRHFETLVALSSQQSEKKIDAIIWPETATAFFDTYTLQNFKTEIQKFIPENGHLITGVLDFERDINSKTKMFNRLSVFNSAGERVETYDKHHLVPFGEYLPFENHLPFNPIASNGQSFERGSGIRTIWLDGVPPFSALICYEAIFPGRVAETFIDAPDWLLNITNDGWYGYTTGPFQHLAITQTRAVEEGVPLVRVANTGISALVDSYGQLVDHIPLQRQGILDVSLPGTVITFYAIFGDIIFFIMAFISGILGLIFHRLKR